MEGVVNHIMRHLLTRIGGIDRCVTEFIRINDDLYPAKVFHKYSPELAQGGRTPAGTPVYLQLLGANPESMASNAQAAVALGAPGIDLNFGCPAKCVTRNNGGSILLKSPEKVFAITAAVRKAVPAHIPVTAKIRLGYENATLLKDNAQAIIDAGANELTIHARTKVDGYKPPAYWQHIREVSESSPIPVIANGEIWDVADYYDCQQQSLCEDVMIGRGAISKPDLPLLIKNDIQSLPSTPLTWLDMLELLITQLDFAEIHFRQKHIGNPVKQWLGYMRRSYSPAERVLEDIKRLRLADDIRQVLNHYLEQAKTQARVAA